MRYIINDAIKLDDVGTESKKSKVAITFDDAFECLLTTAIPITKRLNIPITIFAVSGNLGRPPAWAMDGPRADSMENLMDAGQLNLASRETNCIIGSHTVTHAKLAHLESDELQRELENSRESLSLLLGYEMKYLALPHGSYNHNVIDLAKKAGYRAILTLDEISNPRNWPSGTIGRFSASPDMWFIEFFLTVHGAYSWLHSWRTFVRSVRSKLR
jgi:peptidoglycan/xylan/chitin deacetylase (PgdA/CDA1 family)